MLIICCYYVILHIYCLIVVFNVSFFLRCLAVFRRSSPFEAMFFFWVSTTRGQVAARQRGLWKELSDGLEGMEDATVLWLAWRLGWECGETLRTLHAFDISWGTYADRA